MSKSFSIGEAARRAGVSVQTLRHYDKLCLLTPSRLSASGYRRYTERDCERLQLIRTLRDLGFDLDTISGLLGNKFDAARLVELRLQSVELEQRALKRRQLVLRAALQGERSGTLERLQRKHVLAKLDRLERETFLAVSLNWKPDGSPASQAVWRAAVFDLPEEFDEAQLETWLELAEIATDKQFRNALERQRLPMPGIDANKWGAAFQGLFEGALAAVRDRRTPEDEAARGLIDECLGAIAPNCRADRKFVRRFAAYLKSAYDPRIARYWELISRLKGHPPLYRPEFALASEWLLAAITARGIKPNELPAA